MKILFLLPLFLLAACTYAPSNHSSDIVFVYSLYDSLLREKKPDVFRVTHRPLGDSTYAVILNGNFFGVDAPMYNNEEIYRLKLGNDGIYTTCKGSFILTYAFAAGLDSDIVDEQKKCDPDWKFRYSHICFVEKKAYKNTEQILRYSEMSAEDAGMASYYLKGFGFLSYDYSGRYNFILCRKSYNTGLADSVLQAIGDTLVRDSSFFVRHIINSQR